MGTIDANGNYTAPSANTSTNVMVTAIADMELLASAQVVVVAPGTVAPTANPQVALYTIYASGRCKRHDSIWSDDKLRPHHVDTSHSDRRRTGRDVRRGHAGQHPLPHASDGEV